MIKALFKLILKIALTLGAIGAVLVAIFYISDRQTDYIEIYNDEDEGDLF